MPSLFYRRSLSTQFPLGLLWCCSTPHVFHVDSVAPLRLVASVFPATESAGAGPDTRACPGAAGMPSPPFFQKPVLSWLEYSDPDLDFCWGAQWLPPPTPTACCFSRQRVSELCCEAGRPAPPPHAFPFSLGVELRRVDRRRCHFCCCCCSCDRESSFPRKKGLIPDVLFMRLRRRR